MKMLKRLINLVYVRVFWGAEPDLTPFSYPTVHTPGSHHAYSPDGYFAGLPRRPQPIETLAGFRSRPAIEVMHPWHPPVPYRLPIND